MFWIRSHMHNKKKGTGKSTNTKKKKMTFNEMENDKEKTDSNRKKKRWPQIETCGKTNKKRGPLLLFCCVCVCATYIYIYIKHVADVFPRWRMCVGRFTGSQFCPCSPSPHLGARDVPAASRLKVDSLGRRNISRTG